MKIKVYIVSAIAILFLIMGFTKLKSKKFEVEILQNGQRIEIVNNTVELEKEEFQIRITLKKQHGVYMSASFQRDYFDLGEDEAIKDYKWLASKVLAEATFNENKELFTDDESLSYLFYDKTQDWHRFDKEVKVKRRKVIGTKTVRKIRIKDTKEEIPLADISQDIYLFFVATERYERNKIAEEFGRLKVQIKWK